MSDPESWSPCPPGELSRMQHSLQQQGDKRRSRRRFLIAGSFLLMATGGTAGALLMRAPQQKMTCQEAIDLMPAYYAKQITSENDRQRLEAHFDRCPRCRKHYDDFVAKA